MVGLHVFKGDTSRASEDILWQSPEILQTFVWRKWTCSLPQKRLFGAIYWLVFNKSLFNLATLMISVCPFQRCWRIFSDGSNQNSQSTWECIFFYVEMASGRLIFFPRLPNSFFFFQKIKCCYLDTEHRGRRGVLACVAREPQRKLVTLSSITQFSHSLLSD